MPTLYDRIAQIGDTTPGLNPHVFAAAVRELAAGAVTKAQVVAALKLDATSEANLDTMIAHYGTLTIAEKREYISTVNNVAILIDARLYTEAQATARLGL